MAPIQANGSNGGLEAEVVSNRSSMEERVELEQARAWMEATRPADFARWDRALEAAEAGGDEPKQEQLRREIVDLWRDRRDDDLPWYVMLHAEEVQAKAWLRAIDPERYDDWSRAHELAYNRAESAIDYLRLVQVWRDGTAAKGGAKVDREGREAEAELRRAREKRLGQARAWFEANDPHYYRTWEQCRGFADSIADQARDDCELVRRWLQRTRGTPEEPAAQRVIGMTTSAEVSAVIAVTAARRTRHARRAAIDGAGRRASPREERGRGIEL